MNNEVLINPVFDNQEIQGSYYNNQNINKNCKYIYEHFEFFEDLIKKYDIPNIIPIDIEISQYINELSNYQSEQLPNKLLNYICHFFNKHNSKLKFYFFTNSSLIVFCECLPKGVSKLYKEKFKQQLAKYKINEFIFKSID